MPATPAKGAAGSAAPVSPPPETILRKVFNKFDADGSGEVDVQEMTAMVKSLKINMTQAQVKKLVQQADPNRNGSIDFAEFQTALKKQLREGGALAQVATEAGGSFGFLNPLSWFQSDEAGAPSSAGKSKKKQPAVSASFVVDYGNMSTTSRSSISPTHRMKKTQHAVAENNHQNARQMRDEADVAKNWFQQQQEDFLAEQHKKVLRGHEQARERAIALEDLKQTKRQVGSEMRQKLAKRWKEELIKKREFVEKSHSAVFDARKKKQGLVRTRLQAEREQAIQIGAQAKIARAERREQAKATVKREEQAAKEYTERVRYETRPEVRKEGKDLFQAQRDAIAAEAREKLEEERRQMAVQRERYMNMASGVKARVDEMHASTKAAKERLAEARRQDAATVRATLNAERERKRQHDEESRENKQALHDEIHTWSIFSFSEPTN